jgi:hypothetical protein
MGSPRKVGKGNRRKVDKDNRHKVLHRVGKVDNHRKVPHQGVAKPTADLVNT